MMNTSESITYINSRISKRNGDKRLSLHMKAFQNNKTCSTTCKINLVPFN
jgi:hypothetical protein